MMNTADMCRKLGEMRPWAAGQCQVTESVYIFFSYSFFFSFFLKSEDYGNHLNSEERVPNLILKKTDRQFSD